jgi:hypothetical protein
VAATSGGLGSLPGSGRAQLQSRAVVLASKKTVPTTELADTVLYAVDFFRLSGAPSSLDACLRRAIPFGLVEVNDPRATANLLNPDVLNSRSDGV